MGMIGIIYKTTNLITGKIYIGQTTKKDLNYLGTGTYILNSINKYGEQNFKRETLKENIGCKTALNFYERIFIKKYNSIDPEIGYNILPGGEGVPKGYKHSEESNKKLSNSLKLNYKNLSLEEKLKRNNKASNILQNRSQENKDQWIKNISFGLQNMSLEKKEKRSENISKGLIKKINLSKQNVVEIINLLKTTKLTQRQIGDRFNLNYQIIGDIKRNTSFYNKLYNLYY